MKAERPFRVDERLTAEAPASADLPLCRLLLRDEARFPWIVLVPRRAGVSEAFNLLPGDRARLWAEVDLAAAALKAATGADKINVAAFGNLCPQLHVHVVARRAGDAAWPGSAIGLPREGYASGVVPAFWPALLARLALDARQRP